MMEVMVGKPENLKKLDETGVPWKNMVAFVGHNYPMDIGIIKEIHNRGTICIQGSHRNYDRQFIMGEINNEELEEGYKDIIESGIEIIEADLSLEAGRAIEPFQQKSNLKNKYFNFKKSH